MKLQFTIFAFILGFTLVNAQETENPIQKNQFNFSKNFKSDISDEYGSSKNDYTFGYQRNINEDISIGLNLNYNSMKGRSYHQYNDITYISNESNIKSIGAAITFNYDWSRIIGINTKKFDLYTGTSIGVSVLDRSGFEINPTNGLVTGISKYTSNEYFIGGQLGARYWITKNIGVSADVSNSFYNPNGQQDTKLSFGLNYKF